VLSIGSNGERCSTCLARIGGYTGPNSDRCLICIGMVLQSGRLLCVGCAYSDGLVHREIALGLNEVYFVYSLHCGYLNRL